MKDYQPELATPPAGLLEGNRKRVGKHNGTAKAFGLALKHEGEWVRAFVYDYEPTLESVRNAYNASRSRLKLLRQYADNFGKVLEAVCEHDTANSVYVVWLRVAGDAPAKTEGGEQCE